MKIIITESQMKRLQENMLPSNEDPIGVLHRTTKHLEPILTKIFNELVNTSVSDIQGTNFDNIRSVLSEIEQKTRLLERLANDYIDSQSEDDNWDLENRLTDASYEFNRKLDIVDDLVYKLSQLHEYMLEKDIMSKFQPLDITDIQ
jgi:hypothetical protein